MIAKRAFSPTKALPSARLILVSYFSTSSKLQPHSHWRPQQEEESRSVRVSVWWDFQNCDVPADVNVFRVSHAITAAVRANGMKGPVQITAFGDVSQLPRSNQEALSATGITMTHVPNGGNNSGDKSFLMHHLMYWVSRNPPPAHFFLISNDTGFAGTLHWLRMSNYNVLLAAKEAPGVLCSAASIMWRWNDLVKGENLTGKYFNQPPDGPYGSWYGHYRLPLEDPFAVAEPPPPLPSLPSPKVEATIDSEPRIRSIPKAVLPLEDPLPVVEPSPPPPPPPSPKVEANIDLEPRIRPIPKAVVMNIRQIVSSYPQGISITSLRAELLKREVAIDKDFYGHKRFSRFLQAMQVLQVTHLSDGQYLVRLATTKAVESSESLLSTAIDILKDAKPLPSNSSRMDTYSGAENLPSSERNISMRSKEVQKPRPLPQRAGKMYAKSPDRMDLTYPVGEKVLEKASTQVSNKPTPEVSKQEHAPDMKEFICPVSEEVSEKANVEETGEQLSPAKMTKEHESEKGFFKKVRRILFSRFNKESEDSIETPTDALGREAADKQHCELPSSCEARLVSSCSSPNADSRPVSKSNRISEASSESVISLSAGDSEISSENLRGPGLFSRIKNWWKSRRTSPEAIDKQPSKVFDQNNGSRKNHELYSNDSFWSNMEPFIRTRRGSLAITESKSREQMAENLQKEGPSVLKSLKESDMLMLVDILITEKKWVDECPSEASPFKVTLSLDNAVEGDKQGGSNGLSSMFLKQKLQSNLVRSQEVSEEKKLQNNSYNGVSSPTSNQKSFKRSKSEILMDCRNLVQEIVKNYPDGYNMGCFPKLFFERYGYRLAVDKLGYPKLASLLEIMPGVRVESTYILPKATKSYNKGCCDSVANSNGVSLEVPKKENELDSGWDELGPVDDNQMTESQPVVQETKAGEGPKESPYYEPPYLSESSDSEIESTLPEGQANSSASGNNSSLLEILDTFYGSKSDENGDKKDDAEKEENKAIIDSNGKGLQQPNSSSYPYGRGRKAETQMAYNNFGEMQRPGKTYSFVADQVGDKQQKTIDDILSSWKQTSEPRMHS